MIALLLYQAGSFFSRILPFKLPELIAWTIGRVSCLFRVKTRRVVVDNLRIIHGGRFDERELRRMSARVIMNFARSILVFLKMPHYHWDELKERVDFSEFDRAVAELGGKPVFVLASAHVGPWELGGLCVSRRGFTVHTVALAHPSGHVTRFFDRRRRRVGVHAHPLSGAYPALREAVDRGEIVALLIDRAYGKSRKKHRFFGVESELPIGHLVLSVRCGVPVITGIIVFEDGGRFRYVHGGTHQPPASGEESDRLEALQDRCVEDLQRLLRDHSEQWFRFVPLETS
jgi:KDO2-lipid IV(A) lauroyltransferase